LRGPLAAADRAGAALCSTVQKFSGVTRIDVAQAMDICQSTTANPPLSQKKWGLISATQRLADGRVPNAADLSNIQSWQNAILKNYGTGGMPC